MTVHIRELAGSTWHAVARAVATATEKTDQKLKFLKNIILKNEKKHIEKVMN